MEMWKGGIALLAVGFWPLALCGQPEATLRGAGATFPAPIYQKWIESFQGSTLGLRISYEAVGSQEGMDRLRRGEVDFAASDILPDKNMQEQLGVETLPSVVGAVVPAYNIRGMAHDLRFTPELLAEIFLGRITKWNDPRIKDVNRGANLPAADIIVVHRSDGSGTTFVWSDYLSKTTSVWRDSVGVGGALQWPAGQAAKGNDGVAALLTSTPYSIGYLEFIYALRSELSYGAVKNAAGKFVRPDIDSITLAVRGAGPGREAYPIASFTWLLIPSKMPAGAKRERLASFLDWVFSSGQRQAGALGYVALPEELAAQQRAAVARFRGR